MCPYTGIYKEKHTCLLKGVRYIIYMLEKHYNEAIYIKN